jgi:hypothetical protein
MKNVAIVVNSCHSYHLHSCPKLIDSLIASGISSDDIYIIIGDSPTIINTIFPSTNIKCFYRTYSNIDNNGLIWLSTDNESNILNKYSWIFYLHDTCIALPEFATNINIILNTYPTIDAIRLHDKWSMSMGFYKLSILRSKHIQNFLFDSINYDQSSEARLRVKHTVEDAVFGLIDNKISLSNNYSMEDPNSKSQYNTSTQRIIEKYKLPGLLKFKANVNEIKKIELFH